MTHMRLAQQVDRSPSDAERWSSGTRGPCCRYLIVVVTFPDGVNHIHLFVIYAKMITNMAVIKYI